MQHWHKPYKNKTHSAREQTTEQYRPCGWQSEKDDEVPSKRPKSSFEALSSTCILFILAEQKLPPGKSQSSRDQPSYTSKSESLSVTDSRVSASARSAPWSGLHSPPLKDLEPSGHMRWCCNLQGETETARECVNLGREMAKNVCDVFNNVLYMFIHTFNNGKPQRAWFFSHRRL